MGKRLRRLLRISGRTALCIVVAVIMLVGDILSSIGQALRSILPKNFEEFLKDLSTAWVFVVLGIATGVWTAIHIAEGFFFAYGQILLGVFFFFLSKIYFLVVVSYLGQVYSERMLAINWIRRVYEWYVGWREYLKSRAWYITVREILRRIRDVIWTAYTRYREHYRGRSQFMTIWGARRRKRFRS
jgi:hypothetical protein